jgi:hypothetical protein
MRKTCVVNFACPGRERYMEGQARLKLSLEEVYKKDCILWAGRYPPGSPTHQEVPYAFKYYAIQTAFERGYDCALWLDASCVIRKPLDRFFRVIWDEGVIAFCNACWEHHFTSEDCLNQLGCSIEEAKTFPQCLGGVIGFNQYNQTAMNILREMFELSRDGISFQGGSGKSSAPGFQSHRHDQSCLSYLLHKYGISLRSPNVEVCYSNDSKVEDSIIELRGM